jgi:amidase
MNAYTKRDTVFIHTFSAATFQASTHSASGTLPDVLRVGVKDLVSMVGTITTAGSQAVARIAEPATKDAACLAGLRRGEQVGRAHIVGKTNLHELAYGGDGLNQFFGTPPNPLDSNRVPGGSSSGSASAIGFDRVDAAIGSDTGGSIRIPAACCGLFGLKTTWGRISTDGVWPLAPMMDSIGPMAATTENLIELMDLLEPGFRNEIDKVASASTVGIVIGTGSQVCDPLLERAVAAALAAAEIRAVPVEAPWWSLAVEVGLTALIGEAYRTLSWLLKHEQFLEPRIAARIRLGTSISDQQLADAHLFRHTLVNDIQQTCQQVQLIATPTMPMLAPMIDDQAAFAPYTTYTRPANLAGTPAIAIPIPLIGVAPEIAHLKGSLQLMGPPNSEALLVSTAKRIEAAVRR